MMEYTTPPSYGSTVVNVGGIAKDGEVLCAGCSNSFAHTETTQDAENEWPEPKAIDLKWEGKNKDGQEVVATMTGNYGERLDRVDVLSHVPGLIKTLVGGVVGTKPYIYMVRGSPLLNL